jgi:predicted XRE-type DNA-binding protein
MAMKKSKQRRLEAAGWKVGSAAEFLDMSPEEAAFVELKVALSHHLRVLREDKGMTQAEVADVVESSQSRVAKMEAADPEVTVDLLLRTLLALGMTRKGVAKVIASPVPRSAA